MLSVKDQYMEDISDEIAVGFYYKNKPFNLEKLNERAKNAIENYMADANSDATKIAFVLLSIPVSENIEKKYLICSAKSFNLFDTWAHEFANDVTYMDIFPQLGHILNSRGFPVETIVTMECSEAYDISKEDQKALEYYSSLQTKLHRTVMHDDYYHMCWRDAWETEGRCKQRVIRIPTVPIDGSYVNYVWNTIISRNFYANKWTQLGRCLTNQLEWMKNHPDFESDSD